MIEFIYGVPSSGKTTLLYEKIREDLRSGGEAILIVPDQEALDAEAALARMCRGVPTLGLRVYGFSRLADDIFRKYGGVSYDPIDKTGQTLSMFLSVSSVAPALKAYGKVSPSDASLLSTLLAAVRELKRQGVTAQDILDAGKKVASPQLRDKLEDLSLILPAYNEVMNRCGEDPDDVLGKLYRVLLEHGGLPGVSVYIDSFVSFTAVQYKITELLMRTCKDTVITFGVPCPGKSADRFGLLSPVYDSEKKLRAAARRCGEIKDTVLDGTYASPVMAALERALRADVKESTPSDGCIRFFRTKTEYDCAELVAADIKRRLREGFRCRDIAVLCSSAADWRGIMDAALDRFGVPYFISTRDDARQKALFRLILSALGVCSGDFRTRDVCAYIKTGLLRVPTEDTDTFDNYISRREVKGVKAYSDDFTGSPDGYGVPSDESAAKKLRRINDTRAVIMTPLIDLHEDLKGCGTAKEISAALVRFLCSAGIPETLEELRIKAKADGDVEEAEQTGQLWNIFVRVTEQLCRFCGDLPMSATQYRRLFDTVLSETDIGKIPTSTDQVTIGEGGMLRVHNIKHVYLIGCNEGTFPGVVSGTGLFSDSDRLALSDAGIELESGTDKQNERLLYDFYRCACSASLSATFCYCKSGGKEGERYPCHPLSEIEKAFPDAVTVTSADVRDIAASRSMAFEYYASHRGTPEGMAMGAVLSRDPEAAGLMKMLDTPLVSSGEKLSAETAKLLMPGNIRISSTRLSKFAGCPFRHFCEFFLRLNDNGDILFDTVEFGIFVHFVLQCLTEDCIKDENTIGLRGKELEELIDKYVASYCRMTLGTDPEKVTGRFRAALKRLKKCVNAAAEDVLNELRTGKFRPVAAELKIGGADGIPPMTIEMKNGKKTYLTGKIDRMDTYVENGVTYVKLVDYKTGTPHFSISELAELGKDVQLLVYMLAICSPDSVVKNPVPAALFYIKVLPETLKAEKSGEIPQAGAMTRTGVALSDAAVADALEPGMTKKGGQIYKAGNGMMTFASDGEMTALFDQVSSAAAEAAERMADGDVSVGSDPDNSQCNYCRYTAVCRYTGMKKRKAEF